MGTKQEEQQEEEYKDEEKEGKIEEMEDRGRWGETKGKPPTTPFPPLPYPELVFCLVSFWPGDLHSLACFYCTSHSECVYLFT